jgi:hypothetical protein
MRLNGIPLDNTYINHSDIISGGTLEFEMAAHSSIWGSRNGDAPTTEISEHLILPSPFIAKGDITFRDSTEIVLGSSEPDAKIYYAIDSDDFQIYKNPFTVNKDSKVKLYSERGDVTSPILTTPFYKIDPNLSITLESDYANQYSAGGNDALIDGIRSTKNYRTGSWQGYYGTDMIATVDLGRRRVIYNLEISFLKDQGAWIFLPKEVDIFTSKDGINFSKETTWKFKKPEKTSGIQIETVKLSKLGEIRYVKVVAKKLDQLPTWHVGYESNGKSWIFVDEISVE